MLNQIEKNIPLPSGNPNMIRGAAHDWDKFEPGDSKAFDPGEEDPKKVRQRVYNAAREWARRAGNGWKWLAVIREEPVPSEDGRQVGPATQTVVRIWRLENSSSEAA